MSQNLLSVAVVIGALKINKYEKDNSLKNKFIEENAKFWLQKKDLCLF